jgi:hypothetical protein
MQPGGAHTTRRLHNTKKRALILVSLNAPFLLRRRLCVHARAKAVFVGGSPLLTYVWKQFAKLSRFKEFTKSYTMLNILQEKAKLSATQDNFL